MKGSAAYVSKHLGAASYVILVCGVVLAIVLLARFKSAVNKLQRSLAVAEAESPFRVGDYVPDIPVVSVAVELRDTTVFKAAPPPAIVYIWSPDCRYCIAERGKLGSFAQLARDKGYSFVAVSTGTVNDTRRLFPHLLSFPVLGDPYGVVVRNYRVYGTPAFLSVNKSLRVDRIHLGYVSEDDFASKMLP